MFIDHGQWTYAILSKSQHTSGETSRNVESLTRRTTDLAEETARLTEKAAQDSATIKWITVLSSFYLPASLVTVSAGTDSSVV